MGLHVTTIYTGDLAYPNGAARVLLALWQADSWFSQHGIAMGPVVTPGRIWEPGETVPTVSQHTPISRLRAALAPHVLRRAFLARRFLDATLWASAERAVERLETLPGVVGRDQVVLCHEIQCVFKLRLNIDRTTKLLCVFHGNPVKALRCYYPWLEGSAYDRRLLAMMQSGLRSADRVVAVSEDARQEALRLCPDLDENQVDVVHNGIRDLAPPIRCARREGPLHLVCVGSVTHRKSQDVIIRALHMLEPEVRRHYRLTIVGEGAQRGEFQQLAKRLDLDEQVVFTGLRHDVEQILAGADAFVLTSRDEGLSIAVLEAMRAALPVITTRAGGMAQLVEHERTGLLIEYGPEFLATPLRRVAGRPELLRAWGEQGRQRFVNHFSLTAMLEGYARILSTFRD